jgi:hypothetical protein
MQKIECKFHGIVNAELVCCECKEMLPAYRELTHWFEEVMSVLHRDDGQYLSFHGVELAAREAIRKHYELLSWHNK